MTDDVLSDRDLADVEAHVDCHATAGRRGVFMEFAEMRSLLAEVKRHRAAQLSAEDREALADLAEELRGNAHGWEGGAVDIVAALDRLLAAGQP